MIKHQILDCQQTLQKIRRIAFEIYEQNFEETQIVLAGIAGQGHVLAERLAAELKSISAIEVILLKIDLDKTQPYRSQQTHNFDKSAYVNKTVVVVDDVLNTGRTMVFGLLPFVEVPVKRLQVAVMVNRGHHCYPVSADYIGYALSTTLNEHVAVVLSDEANLGVYLS